MVLVLQWTIFHLIYMKNKFFGKLKYYILFLKIIKNSLLGHNGAGKTTTINLLTGMLQNQHNYGSIESIYFNYF